MKQPRIFEYRGHWLATRGESPHWQICWFDARKRRVQRRSTGTSHLETAKDELVQVVTEPTGRQSSPGPGMPFRPALRVYLESIRPKPGYSTAKRAAKHLMDFADHHGIAHLDQFTLFWQDRYTAHRLRQIRAKGHPGSLATIKRELGVLGTAMNQVSGYRRRTPHDSTVDKRANFSSPDPK